MLSVVVLLMVLFCYKGDMDRMAYFLDIYTQRMYVSGLPPPACLCSS